MRLPKIVIGTQKKRNHKDFSHDVETTSDFGFCQPTIVRHLNANSSSKLSTMIGVRLAPLPCPTFGRIKLKTYNTLVPIQEVFEAYDYMQKKTAVTSALGSYIPESAQYIMSNDLFSFLYYYSLNEYTHLFGLNGQPLTDEDCNAFLCFSLQTPNLSTDNIVLDSIDNVNNEKYYKFVDGNFSSFGSFINSVESAGKTKVYDAFCEAMYSCHLFTKTAIGGYDYYVLELGETDNLPANYHDNFILGGLNHDVTANKIFEGVLPIAALSGSADESFDAVRRSFYLNRSTGFNPDMFLRTAEITVSWKETVVEEDVEVEYDCYLTVPYQFVANWTKRGQRLFKILNSIGLRSFRYNTKVDLNKLYAYYKAWFDQLNPGRVQQWRETHCYKFIHSFYDSPVQMYDLLYDDSNELNDLRVFTNEAAQWDFADFLVDLTNCCYVLPIDNFTAATGTPLLQHNMVDDFDVQVGDGSDDNTNLSGGTTDVNYPSATGSNEALNGLVITGLLRLYHYANKNSVIGSRIEDYLRTRYGYTIPKSNILNGSEQNITIEEIFANAGTTENYLGEIGGRGSNKNVGNSTIKFECEKPSIFVQFVAIVPYGDYVQGNVRGKFGRLDWYQPEYDSLGKEAIAKSEILARTNDYTIQDVDSTFGFVPMYWRDKVQNSTHNGAFALPSQRANLLPYSLDRLFNERSIVKGIDYGKTEALQFLWKQTADSVIAPSEEMRYIGRTPDYGTYDRIFFDNTGYFDNFILHIVEDWDYYDASKSIAMSFDTVDDEDNGTTSVTAS